MWCGSASKDRARGAKAGPPSPPVRHRPGGPSVGRGGPHSQEAVCQHPGGNRTKKKLAGHRPPLLAQVTLQLRGSCSSSRRGSLLGMGLLHPGHS